MDNTERFEEVTKENAILIWQSSRLSISMQCEKAPEILKANGTVIGTLGNFSASIGKAKSKKTFNVSAIVAAALKSGTVLLYSAELPKDKCKILYVDTEQSPYHCLKVMERILRMAGLPTDRDNENLEFLALRKYTPKERIAAVEQAIYNTPDLGFVVIDGIRDMVYDINSPGESTRIISKLMQWTDDRQIHIHTILHQNKGDDNARGHIGTELNNKAETVLLVEKEKNNSDISKVSAMHIRAMDFKSFAFRINEQALPELVDGYQPQEKKVGRPEQEEFDPCKHITEQQHRIALEAAFGLREEYGYKELEKALIVAYASVGVKLSHNKTVKLITKLRCKRIIVQEKGRKYTLMPDYHY
ncbi:AAA family ATPase [uncultured Bacteroides sp.]|uniref:AAA family ATPase n=1 Tax=uncultured Bacteroides sp. TaxID=162156 RepID=UPI0025E2C4BF|nr:AAA family ATPase [uncultured Bacteroides sp.]